MAETLKPCGRDRKGEEGYCTLHAAEILGIRRTQLHYRIRQLAFELKMPSAQGITCGETSFTGRPCLILVGDIIEYQEGI